MSEKNFTVRIKVTSKSEKIRKMLKYRLVFFKKSKSYNGVFDDNGCSKVYNADYFDIVWFEIYIGNDLIDKIFVMPTMNGKYNDNSYEVKVKYGEISMNKTIISVGCNKPIAPTTSLKKVSFCEALDLFIKNRSIWTFDNPPDFYSNEIGDEQSYIRSLGIHPNTTDGVDLQYFLVQYRYRRTVDPFTGFLAWSFLTGYIYIGSAFSAYHSKSGVDGYFKDILNDFSGNNAGHDTAVYGLENYKERLCD